MQMEPEPTQDWGEETSSQHRGGHVTRPRDKGRGAGTSDETASGWTEQEVREVSKRVLSMLRRTLEAGTLEPEGVELRNQAMRDQGPSGPAIADNRLPRRTMLTEGEEVTHKETQGTHGTRRKCRRQKRKVRSEWKTET